MTDAAPDEPEDEEEAAAWNRMIAEVERRDLDEEARREEFDEWE